MESTPSRWKYSELALLLANLFYRQDDFIRIIIDAGFSPAFVQITNSAINNWTFILYDAEISKRISAILDAVIRAKPDNEYLLSLRQNNGFVTRTPYARKDLNWKNNNIAQQKEALIYGSSSLQPIYFLELGVQKSKCVVYIKTPKALGTGFVVKNNYIITNNHVIGSKEIAAQTQIIFYFERDAQKKFREKITVGLDPDNGFATCLNTDWTIVKLKQNPLKSDEYLNFAEQVVAENDFVNIVQHPGGDEKKIGLYHNLVTFSGDGLVQYLTDTEQGSSGSPVFNSNWEVVALHHSSVRLEDKDGGDELRNQGAAIQLVAAEIRKEIAGIEF